MFEVSSLPRRAITFASAKSVRSSITSPGFGKAAPKRPVCRCQSCERCVGLRLASAIEAYPFGIHENRIADFNFDIAVVANGIDKRGRARQGAAARVAIGQARSNGRALAKKRLRSYSLGHCQPTALAPRGRKCAPARYRCARSTGLKPTKIGRSGDCRAGRSAITRPIKSLRADIIRWAPKSCAVVCPLTSLVEMWPFSMRITPSASVP